MMQEEEDEGKKTFRGWQVYTAVAMLLSGVALSVAGFLTPPRGEIHDSVLWYFAQCLIYAGSIFGVSVYVNGKISSLKERLRPLDKNAKTMK